MKQMIVLSGLKTDRNDKCSLVKYDIREFYPSIMKKTVDGALNLAEEYILIPRDEINIIKPCCKLLLYHNEDLWIKKGVSNFGSLMGSFDRDNS